MITKLIRCVCDARYEGCDHPNPCAQPEDGTRRGPWCAVCQPRRLAAVTAQLEAIHQGHGGGAA